MKKKVVVKVQVTLLFLTLPPLMNYFCLSYKTEICAKTTPRAPKPFLRCQLVYKGGQATHLSAQGSLATSGAIELCHMFKGDLEIFYSCWWLCWQELLAWQ